MIMTMTLLFLLATIHYNTQQKVSEWKSIQKAWKLKLQSISIAGSKRHNSSNQFRRRNKTTEVRSPSRKEGKWNSYSEMITILIKILVEYFAFSSRKKKFYMKIKIKQLLADCIKLNNSTFLSFYVGNFRITTQCRSMTMAGLNRIAVRY